MFKADFDPATIAPKVTLEKSPAMLPKGVGTRTALEVLRTSGEALSSEELAYRVLVLMNKDTDPKVGYDAAKDNSFELFPPEAASGAA